MIGKPGVTRLGVHLIFQQEELPKPHPNPAQQEPHRPSLPLGTPKPLHTEDLQPEDWKKDTITSTDGSATDSFASIAEHHKAPSDLEGVEAGRRRFAAQRIRLEQLQKEARLDALQLRQRADDLEQETAEEAARLLREMEEDTTSIAMDENEDGFDVRSNHSYTPTETSSSSPSNDDEYWSSPFRTPTLQARDIDERYPTPTLPTTPPPSIGPSGLRPHVTMEARPQAQRVRPLSRQHAIAIPLASSPAASPPRAEPHSFVVVTREVIDGVNDLTGSPVRRTKRYRARAADLESLHGDSDMKEL